MCEILLTAGVILLIAVLYDLTQKGIKHSLFKWVAGSWLYMTGTFGFLCYIALRAYPEALMIHPTMPKGIASAAGMIVVIALMVLLGRGKDKALVKFYRGMLLSITMAGPLPAYALLFQLGRWSEWREWDALWVVCIGVIAVGSLVKYILDSASFLKRRAIKAHAGAPSVQAIMETYVDDHVTVTRGQYDRNVEQLIGSGVFRLMQIKGLNDFSVRDEIKLYVDKASYEQLMTAPPEEEAADEPDAQPPEEKIDLERIIR